MELDSQNKHLPRLYILIGYFFSFVFVVAYLNYFLLDPNEGNELVNYNFKNFIIYNFSLKTLYYPFRILFVSFLLLFGAFLFKVRNLDFLSAIKISIIAEIVRFLPDLIRVIWFGAHTKSYDSILTTSEIHDLLTLNTVFGLTSDSLFYSYLNIISIFQIIYLCVLALLISNKTEEPFVKSVLWSGLLILAVSFIYASFITLITI